MRDAVRVALLARPGAGADRLREALNAAGAQLVLEADPTTLEPATLAGANAESVVVLLDAAVEEALDRLDPVLHDPGIDVLYEESAVAAAREGWDAARWSRHLSAKLLRHGDVLPPGREADDATVVPASRTGASKPVDPSPPVDRSPAPAPPATSMFDPVAAEYDPAGDDASLAPPMLPVEEAPAPILLPADDAPASTLVLADEPDQAPEPDSAPEPDWGNLTLAMDDDAPASASPQTPTAPAPTTPAPAPPPPAVSPAPPASATPASAVPAPRGDAIRDFRRDLAGIEQRIAAMGLVADDPPVAATPEAEPGAPVAADEPLTMPSSDALSVEMPSVAVPVAPDVPVRAGGAVLVFAGIGGPDAVRQFLGALPDAFPRPVLIHQRLDGGRHDRLVQQMARATSLPVHLAAEHEAVAPGHVYILPPGLGLSDTDGLRFAASADPLATLPSADSAVLMFSGSDTALVDAAMDHAQAGALVAGQAPEDCYDAAAADALVARGAQSGQPAELARRLAERWAA